MTDLSRYDDWLVWLREQGRADADIRVVFVGGSAVTGGYDDHSDLDVEVLATPGEAVSAYRRLLVAALRDFAVHQVWELPEATWPDGRQAFLNLTPDAGDLSVPTRIIDLHVSDLADHHRHVDPRRHGEPLVLQLRIVHTPARHDFGLRYLDTDLPEGYAARVEALLPGADLADRAAAAFAWQDELLAQLAA